MKNEKFFITPDMIPKFDIDLENIDFEQLTSKEFQKEFEKSKAYEKYIKPMVEREKAQKKQKRKDWWKNNYWNIINTLIAIAALIIGLMK